jgi:hypothetical protein
MNLRASSRPAVLPSLLSRGGLPTPKFELSRLFCDQIIVEPHSSLLALGPAMLSVWI